MLLLDSCQLVYVRKSNQNSDIYIYILMEEKGREQKKIFFDDGNI